MRRGGRRRKARAPKSESSLDSAQDASSPTFGVSKDCKHHEKPLDTFTTIVKDGKKSRVPTWLANMESKAKKQFTDTNRNEYLI